MLGAGLDLAPTAARSVRGVEPAPSLDLSFLYGVLDPRVTFSRASTATYFDSAGVIQTAAINQHRFDYDPVTLAARGLLLEEARTNLLLNSAGPATQTVTVTAAAHTLSFYGTGTVALGGASTAGPLVGTGAGQRVSLTFTPTAGSLTLTVSGTVTNANLEAGSFATSWVPTSGTAATRAADVATVNTLTPWFSAGSGTVFVEFQRLGVLGGSFPRSLSFSDGTSSNVIECVYSTPNDQFVITAATVAQGPVALANGGTALNKIAAAYALNDTAACLNGGAVSVDGTATIPTVDRLHIGNRQDGARPFSGHLRRIKYFQQRLGNATLQSITQ